MSSVVFIVIPVLILVAVVRLELHSLRQLERARWLMYLSREQWTLAILLSGPFGALAFLYLERNR